VTLSHILIAIATSLN